MENLIINKYKPKIIDNYLYDNEIKDTIYKLMDIDEMSFILNGDMGSGKTSLIDCIVKEYFNNSKYNENILYINNISDQGINFYRNEVRLFCQTNCTINNKKKLILFDDFDQITEQCQQVFRNYIDKYENKIGFIITTSNLHKIVNSIQSRFLVINLEKPSRESVLQLCNNIIKNENIKINESILNHILNLTNNTIYSTLNYLQKIKLIDEQYSDYDISEALTHINYKNFEDYFEYIKKKNLHEAITILLNLVENGFSVIDILDSLILYIKHTDILNEQEKYKIIPFITKYITIFYDIHEHEIELIFFSNNLLNIL